MNIEQLTQHKAHFAAFRELPREVMDELFSIVELSVTKGESAVEKTVKRVVKPSEAVTQETPAT